jgi:hypothetical protein
MLPGHIPAITRLLRGQYAEIAGRLPGYCSANARSLPGRFTGWCADEFRQLRRTTGGQLASAAALF